MFAGGEAEARHGRDVVRGQQAGVLTERLLMRGDLDRQRSGRVEETREWSADAAERGPRRPAVQVRHALLRGLNRDRRRAAAAVDQDEPCETLRARLAGEVP